MSAKKATLDRKSQIDRGEIETKNLAECLKVDFGVLHASLFPKASKETRMAIAKLADVGILKRMNDTAALILAEQGKKAVDVIETHASDTVRGWGAFMVGQLPGLSLEKRLERIKPYADDSHFGVREWAWMAVRAHIASDLEKSVTLLADWTEDESPRVRRFASEATRPRGVWAAHIQRLKEKPEIGLPILSQLKSDPERYVQDSVGNWLNDAAKSQPVWVKKVCAGWKKESAESSTAYILKKALRSL
jgi:3-methyladenine DNA glycosylase AlkC